MTLTLTGIYTAQGDSKTPFIANLVGLATNMILDPVLILGLGTSTKFGSGGCDCNSDSTGNRYDYHDSRNYHTEERKCIKRTRLFAKIPLEYLQGICKIGIPTAIQGMVYCAISMVLTRMVSGFGAEAVATQRVGGQIESISWNTADGFAAALNAFIAQTMVRAKMTVSKKDIKLLCARLVSGELLITLCLYVFRNRSPESFFHEPKAIATAVEYLIIIGFSEAFMCVELTTVGALSGLGKTRLCSIISIAFTSARIPLSIILGGIMGLDGIWWAISSTSIVKGIIFTCTFLWITRKRR